MAPPVTGDDDGTGFGVKVSSPTRTPARAWRVSAGDVGVCGDGADPLSPQVHLRDRCRTSK